MTTKETSLDRYDTFMQESSLKAVKLEHSIDSLREHLHQHMETEDVTISQIQKSLESIEKELYSIRENTNKYKNIFWGAIWAFSAMIAVVNSLFS